MRLATSTTETLTDLTTDLVMANNNNKVLFTVCSAVTVECCVLYSCCVGVFGMVAVM